MPESSGDMRKKRPVSDGLRQTCPKAMLEASTSTRPKRLPQAALCRSSRPSGLRNFCVRTIKSHPFVTHGGNACVSYNPVVARGAPIPTFQVIEKQGDGSHRQCSGEPLCPTEVGLGQFVSRFE